MIIIITCITLFVLYILYRPSIVKTNNGDIYVWYDDLNNKDKRKWVLLWRKK